MKTCLVVFLARERLEAAAQRQPHSFLQVCYPDAACRFCPESLKVYLMTQLHQAEHGYLPHHSRRRHRDFNCHCSAVVPFLPACHKAEGVYRYVTFFGSGRQCEHGQGQIFRSVSACHRAANLVGTKCLNSIALFPSACRAIPLK